MTMQQEPSSLHKDPLSGAELKAVRNLQADPVLFSEQVIGGKLWEGQRTILRSVVSSKRVAVRSCHGAGKSHAAARTAVWFLLTHPYSYVVTTAPTDRQVKKILWQEIRKARTSIKVPCRSSPIIQEWMVEDGWFAIGLSTNDPDSFQGLHPSSGDILVIIDEAAGVEKMIWDAVDGSLSSRGARLLSIGNPTDCKGQFYEEFRAADVKKIRISAFDTPNFTAFGITREDIRTGQWEDKVRGLPLPYPSLVTPDWVSEKYSRWGENNPLYKAKVEGEFPEEDEDDKLIQISWVERAKERYEDWCQATEEEKALVPLEPVELGLDVARYGRNETSLALRRGAIVGIHSTWKGKSTMETVGRTVRVLDETGAEAVKVDDSGVGGGVTDRLDELEKPVDPINSGEAAKDSEQFFNRRAEMWWTGREALQKNELLLIPDDILESQLCNAPRWKIDSRGRIVVETKEDMEKRGLESPDRADSLLLALYAGNMRRGPITW